VATLPRRLLRHIRDHDLFRAGERVGIAVSGGADSIALLRLLFELRHELGIVLSVVHLNHQLRGEESAADEEFVARLAKHLGLEFIRECRDVKLYAAEHKLSLETAAREVRYGFFRKCLKKQSLDKIATAHTLDDQAETVLMKLARGAGTKGLAGIYPAVQIPDSPVSVSKSGSIVRPLLGIRRFDLEAYLTEIGQPWRQDASNRDLRHTRNRIRHRILPRLEWHVNPAVREALCESAEIARVEEEYWAGELQKILPQIWNQTSDCGRLKSTQLSYLPLAVRRRVVRAAAESLGLTLQFRHVEELLKLREDGEKAALPKQWLAVRRKDELRFERGGGREPANYEYALSVPGKLTLAEAGLVLETIVINEDIPDLHILLDTRFSRCKLVVRNWRPSECFWPAYTHKPAKLKQLLQDRHITGASKTSWPLIACGEDILWVRGLGVRRDLIARGPGGVLIRELSISADREFET